MEQSRDTMAEIYKLQSRFSYLQSINVYRDFNESSSLFSLTIVLCEYPYAKNAPRLELLFSGVRDFKVGDIDNLFRNSINIMDVSDHQMEGIRYKVKEVENDLYSFYCDKFDYRI